MKSKKDIIDRTAAFAQEMLIKDPAHDWWHTYRVWKMAAKIAKKESADFFIVEMAALLHDIDDWKNKPQKNKKSTKDGKLPTTNNWLVKNKVSPEIINTINDIILNISFKGIGVKSKLNSLEAKVVQDADRLDAMGAIGIARAFTYGGKIGRSIFEPEKPLKLLVKDLQKAESASSIHHFYDKLLLLEELINTQFAKKIAVQRHKLINSYLRQFYNEWHLT